ncbi:hypothetical protein [Sphingobium sp. LSP13-1-1.1]|uniref:hypothetical protein n=1 Tax=Sphingobium sp. LSP13-1-1.1 TaxID=3135234 RepID=UPI003430E0CA
MTPCRTKPRSEGHGPLCGLRCEADHFHTQFLCLAHFPCLDFKRRHVLIDQRQTIARPAPLRDRFGCGSFLMQDMLWIGLILLLLVASLGYAALCERA